MSRIAVVAQAGLSGHFQLSIPGIVRKALKLNVQDAINFTVMENGSVVMSRATDEIDDPALAQLMDCLKEEMQVRQQYHPPYHPPYVNHTQNKGENWLQQQKAEDDQS